MTTHAEPVRWHILGAGAIGCLWAAYLAGAGCVVTLLLRDVAALENFPGHIRLDTSTGSRRIRMAAQSAGDPGLEIQRLLVAVKAQDTLSALRGLGPRLKPDTPVLLVQNGMGVVEEIAKLWPSLRLQVCSTTHGAYRRSSFQVVHAGSGEAWIGVPPGLDAGRAWDVVAELSGVGLDIKKDDDINTRMWDKLAINCVINPATALLQCRNGDLLTSPAGLDLLARISEEAALVMTAAGLPRRGRDILDRACRVAEATAANYSSMCQDLGRGVATEIDYMNGYLLRRGEAARLALPCNQTLVNLVKLRQSVHSRPPSP